MSAEELTPALLSELRQQLEDKRARLVAEISGLRREEGRADTPDEDPSEDIQGDEGDASVDQEAWDTNRQDELDLRAELAEVEHALSKFALGTYGICEVCGQPIPVARLRRIPEARYDAAHQAEVEARAQAFVPPDPNP